MLNVTVFQSASSGRSPWVDQCLETVRSWALRQDFKYRFLGDELFGSVEPHLQQKLTGRTPVIADIARLDLLANHLERHAGVGIWVDADTLCLDPNWRPKLDVVAGFGEECWIQADDKSGGHARYRSYRTPHNAFMVFSAGSPVLPFLRYLSRSIIERADEAFIAPQMIGPKLLKTLHGLAAFELYPEAGALSPALLSELVTAPGEAVACYRRASRPVPAMLNLCHSLQSTTASKRDLELLLSNPESVLALSGTEF